jgi:tellurite resistance protein
MGLLSRLTANVMPAKKPADEVLLFHGMLLMAGADGALEEEEKSTVSAMFDTLPEFAGKDFGEMLAQANKVVARYGNLKESVKALAEIQSPKIQMKCFVLAADIAMSSGDVDESEDKLLETMQRMFNISDENAGKVLEVLSWKYAQ